MVNLRKAFLSLEYSIIIAIIIAALLAMSIYFQRVFSGRWREAADMFGHGRQYYPAGAKCYDTEGNEIPCGW